jgi:hypothetical protein
MRNPFKKDENISDIAYKKGTKDTEDRLKIEFEQIKQDIINEYEEKLNEKNIEIMLLDTQNKAWKIEHEKTLDIKKEVKITASENKQERYRIDKFKEEISKEILFIMADNTEKYQGLLNLIGVKKLEG